MNKPQITLPEAVADLKHRDEFKVILQFIREERDRVFAELGPAESPNEVMKIAGGVARLDELLAVLTAD